MANITLSSGAQDWWTAGYTGQGIDVALIDTGVAPVEGLDAAGKIVYGPDLSLESQAPKLRNLDTNGHGTFMAGLIAGKDSTAAAPYAGPRRRTAGWPRTRASSASRSARPTAASDVTQVIAAINWVVHHQHDNGLNIRVLNLSYGTNSTQSYTVDPLAYAAEQAWKKGIVVVAAAGNTGYQSGTALPASPIPAYDPYVIAVGGSDSKGNGRPTPTTCMARLLGSSAGGCGALQEPRLRRARLPPPGAARSRSLRRPDPS